MVVDILTTNVAAIRDKMSADMDSFSIWLEEILRERQMSQADLARRSGLSRQAISAYINQKRISPDEEALKALARALQDRKSVV